MNFRQIIITLIVLALTILMFLVSMGCNLKPPIKASGESDKCFLFKECVYWLQKSKDKALCVPLLNECSKFMTYEYCKTPENRIKIKVKTRAGLVEGDDFFAGCYEILK